MGSILIFCAHSDDQVLGAGGTMAKYAREGLDVYTYIFSYGELSHPHMNRDFIKNVRVEESENADKIIGGKGVFFLGLKDGAMAKEIKNKNVYAKLKEIMLKHKPEKIFTHSVDDMLPDHRSVRRAVLRAYDELKKSNNFSCDVYSFDVWNLLNIGKRNNPVLVVDVTKNFKTKIKALHQFKSQINVFTHAYFVNILYLGVYVRAFLYGLKYKYRFAEVFYKLR
ncbi:MAG: PIG-L deacetylase family protein [Candidatus Woesearchaeota archaeon]